MKIRIQGNSLRLRLTQSEVVRFYESGSVSGKIQFPGKQYLNYGLKKTSDYDVTVSFDKESIVVNVPFDIADNWAATSQVGFDASVDLGSNGLLSLLVEKDFKCLSREFEDANDLYPNPNQEDES